MNKNIISLLKGFVCPTNDGMDNRIAVSTVQAKLMQWGYMLTEDAFLALSQSDLSVITKFHDDVIPFLRDKKGGKHNYKALYKNFPQEVMALSDVELYMNAIRHYWSNGNWEPSNASFEKDVKFEKIKYTMLDAGDETRFDKVFTDLVSINQSLTPNDLEIVKWFVNSGRNLVMPEVVPFKENLCTLAAMQVPGLPVKTTTDVLRIAVHLSGGDISLPKVPFKMVRQNRWSYYKVENPERDKFKFKKFTRSERKYILGLLENSNCSVAEMVLKAQRWIRLGEILHPGEYKTRFPRAYQAFNTIRNERVKSWYGKLEAAFDKSLKNGIEVLSERPGEFVRRIDALVRKAPNKDIQTVLNAFGNIATSASNKVLFETYSHFENRREPVMNRSIMVKGARKRTQLPSLPAIKPEVIEAVHSTIFTSLKEKFGKLDSLGNVWIDEELKKIPMPSNMRSMNFSLKPVIRGQRMPIGNPDTKVIRPFVHWMDSRGTEDLDLSVTFIGKKTEVLSFSNLRVGMSCHSGDVRHRRGACAEYVDIHINDALNSGYEYALIDVRNFNGGSLKSVETVFGIMEREHPESNSHWLPDTVSSCQELSSEASNTLIAIIDLKAREYIFLDIDSDGSVTARGDIKNTLAMVKQYAEMPKFSVYDLLMMHVESRGRQVTLDDNVDTYFKFEDFCNSYEEIGKYMGV